MKIKEQERFRQNTLRIEKQAQEKLRKEENQRIRQLKRQEKERQKNIREKLREERARIKELKNTTKAERTTKKLRKESFKNVPLTPVSYDTDSTLSPPSLSDEEFATMMEGDIKDICPRTPTIRRMMEYLPTPEATPRKQRGPQHVFIQESPLKNKRKYSDIDEDSSPPRDSMSIRFLINNNR